MKKATRTYQYEDGVIEVTVELEDGKAVAAWGTDWYGNEVNNHYLLDAEAQAEYDFSTDQQMPIDYDDSEDLI